MARLPRCLLGVFGMSSQWIILSALIAFAGGVASHRLVFIHGELDNFSVVIVKAFIFLWILISGVIAYELNSLTLGSVLGTLLFLVFWPFVGLELSRRGLQVAIGTPVSRVRRRLGPAALANEVQ